jgi:tetratricopeptide (TPR) repeat protein
MPIDLSAAIEHHRHGRLEQAARLYEAALTQEPEHPDALHLLGLVTLQRGDPGRAAALVSRAIAVRPIDAAYHASLAEAFWALGQLDQTVSAYQSALGLQPDHPEYHCNLGATLIDLEAVDEAIHHFREAIRLRPDFAAAHNNLGNALRLKGDRVAAIEHFRKAVQLDPVSAEPRSNLGEMLLDSGQSTEALTHCREAVGLRPDSPPALTNLGNVLHALGRLDEAQACFREAIQQNSNLAAPHAALAGLLEELGDFDRSERELREALRHDPRHAGALARLATRVRERLPDADRAAIEARLAKPGLPAHDRWTLEFGLAQVHDARGEFDRAADLARQANALQLADFQKHGKTYDPRDHEAFVDRLLATFTADYFPRVRGFGLPTRRPVFVVGLPRSGTTLIEHVLASHPSVFGAGELQLVGEILDLLPQAAGRDAPPLDCIVHVDQKVVQALAQRHESELQALSRSADRVVDKMPENTLYLGWIATLFPQAILIHCRRDLRDVALSCWMTHLAHVRWACDPDHIASRINDHLRLMDYWRQVLPIPILEVDYESMVADPEREARELVAWCGLDWNPACLNFHENRRPVRTASAVQVRQPVHSRSVGRWKNYERSLAMLFEKIKEEPGSRFDNR